MSYEIDELLEDAFIEKASDLHISVNSPPMYRLNGKLIPYGETLLTSKMTEKMAKKIVDADDWEAFIKDGELDFSYSLPGVARYRVNVYYQRGTISLVARVIPTNIPDLEELDVPEVLRELASREQGLILVTGPTGSGKSTTLAAMIDYINRRQAKHIITLEDPIEYLHRHNKSIVHQREVGKDTDSFASGLRAALRQDPDIVLVGEMRDLETISTAITAAETGHLVLATLHTNSAAQTINRIIDVFPPHQQSQIRIQITSVLEAVISQRLLLKKDGSGRTMATEILINYPSVANLIRNEKIDQIKNVMQTGRALGMHTLEMSVQKLLQSGEVSVEEAQPYLTNLGEFNANI